jgi:hypothetical protein
MELVERDLSVQIVTGIKDGKVWNFWRGTYLLKVTGIEEWKLWTLWKVRYLLKL